MSVPDGVLLQIQAVVPDNATGLMSRQSGREWFIRRGTSRGDILRTIFLSVMSWEEHETRELLTYKGQSFFSPHWEID